MSKKISQADLLSEGFWDKFRQVGEFGKAVGNVVAPEIADPIKKGVEWMRGTRKNIKRAGMTKDELAMEHIMEDGFFPLPNEKVKWNPKQNTDETYTGNVKVGELEIDPQSGQPKLGRKFAQDKSNYIFKFHPETREIKVVRRPERHLATNQEEIGNSLENAGHDVVGRITIQQHRQDGTIIGSTQILHNGGKVPITFSYNPDNSSIKILSGI